MVDTSPYSLEEGVGVVELTRLSDHPVDGNNTEEVDSYVCLGKKIARDGVLLLEVKRRMCLGGWLLEKFII